MQADMQKIQEATDPNERHRLMQEQMQEMRKMMMEERASHYAPAPMMQPYAQPYYGYAAPMPMMPPQQFMPYPPRAPQFAGQGWGDECHQGRHGHMKNHHEQMEQHLIKIEQLLEKLVELESKQVAK
jgi:arylsulfatase A-like enzyme